MRKNSTPPTEPEKTSEAKLHPRVVRTRSAVLAAGRRLMTERGVRGITVEEITKRTGIAKTTIYRHWPSREDLMLAIIAETGVELPTPHTNAPRRDIRAILVAVWKAMADPIRRSAFASMIDSTAANPELASLHRDFLSARGGPLTDAVTRAVEAGEARTGLDPELGAELLAAPIIIRAFIRADPLDRRYISRLMNEVLGTGLGNHRRESVPTGRKRS